MNAEKRTAVMAEIAARAREYDRRGDVVLRDQAAKEWRALATAGELRRNKRLGSFGR